jgi:hypothetical protein
MRRKTSSRLSWLSAGLLALGLIMSPAAFAQEENEPAGGGEKGRPLDGYLATAALCGMSLFIVGKTARR